MFIKSRSMPFGIFYSFLLIILLAGCGGGGGNTTVDDDDETTVVDDDDETTVNGNPSCAFPGALPESRAGFCGTVISARTGLPVENAEVSVNYGDGARFSTQSNRNGEYSIIVPVKTVQTAITITKDNTGTGYINEDTQVGNISEASQEKTTLPDVVDDSRVTLLKPDGFELRRLGDNIPEEGEEDIFQSVSRLADTTWGQVALFFDFGDGSILEEYSAIEVTFIARGVGGIESIATSAEIDFLTNDISQPASLIGDTVIALSRLNYFEGDEFATPDPSTIYFYQKVSNSPSDGSFKEYTVTIPTANVVPLRFDPTSNPNSIGTVFGIYPAYYFDQTTQNFISEDIEYLVTSLVGIRN